MATKNEATRDREQALAAELVRAVRRLHLSGRRTIGVLPMSDVIAMPDILLRLAAALAEGFAGRVDVLTARDVGPVAMLPGGSRLRGSPDADARARPARWLIEEIAATPEDVGGLLVDLSGLVARGEHADVIAALDGVAVLAESGRLSEKDLAWLRREVPHDRMLGVLLMDVHT